jgi:CheY-like chemotaxis protein
MLTDLMGGELTARSSLGVGSVFKVRLFLPETSGKVQDAAMLPAKVRSGYEGARRKILVVDNEEPDRELLVELLQPLGFELRTAASGHDCLDLLASGYRPDIVLMDLAMPGIDGWETIRRLRLIDPQHAQIAIVSANAFDKGLDNDAGIAPEDFILKPVRHTELLDWIEHRLALRWLGATHDTKPVPAPLPAAVMRIPTPAMLAPLREAAQLGYYRGVLNLLGDLERADASVAPFCTHMRALAQQFEFDAMLREIDASAPKEVAKP